MVYISSSWVKAYSILVIPSIDARLRDIKALGQWSPTLFLDRYLSEDLAPTVIVTT